jgi:hypothetical protein
MVDLRALTLFNIPLISTQDNDLTIDAVYSVICSSDSSEITLRVRDVNDVSFAECFNGCILPNCCPDKALVEGLIEDHLLEMGDKVFAMDEIISEVSLGLDISGALASQGEYPVFPAFVPYLQVPAWDLALADNANLRCAVSQDSLNWLMNNSLTTMPDRDARDFLKALFVRTSWDSLKGRRRRGHDHALQFPL